MFEGALNPSHIIIVLVIALVVFGPKRLPELGRSIGGGIRELKESFDTSSEPAAPRAEEPVAPVQATVAAPAERETPVV